MPISRGIVAVLAVVSLCVPGVAHARTTTIPTTGSGVSQQPPVPLAQSAPNYPSTSTSPPPSARPPAPATAPGVLPNTGADPRLLFLMGAALTLLGAGLRLQTADGDLD